MTRRVRERGDESGERGTWGRAEHDERGAEGGPLGLYVIDEAVIATGLHSTPRYCHETMHIHRPYK